MSTSEDLGYVKRVYVMVNKSTKEEIMESYKDVFEGLGTFSTPYQIQLKADAVTLQRKCIRKIIAVSWKRVLSIITST